MNQYFQLYSCCIPVKGKIKAVICDLQRNIIQPIPLTLYELLVNEAYSNKESLNHFLNTIGEKEKQIIQEYTTFLYNNQFGYTSDKPMVPHRLKMDSYEESISKTNAIVDFDAKSKHSLSQIMPQLKEIDCEVLQIRYFYPVSYQAIENDLEFTSLANLQNLEIILQYSEDFLLDNILKLTASYPVLKKILLTSSPENTVYHQNDMMIIYTTEQVDDEKNCGVTNEFYCIAETQLFIESIHFNSCLNKKIAIDRNGLIRNCPSMRNDFGPISKVKLQDVYHDETFQKIWKITKDKVDVCSDCELRYVCQDCRAYIVDKNNIYSKPVKCTYNPYEFD